MFNKIAKNPFVETDREKMLRIQSTYLTLKKLFEVELNVSCACLENSWLHISIQELKKEVEMFREVPYGQFCALSSIGADLDRMLNTIKNLRKRG